jgi:signal transduction histidine kinase
MALELRIAHKLEAVGQLAAGIAHEINTPVQYIGDSVYFLQEAVGSLNDILCAYRSEVETWSRAQDVANPGDESLRMARERLDEAENRADLALLTTQVPKAFERALDGIERVATIVRAMKEFAHPDSPEQRAADINHAIEMTLIVAQNEYKYVARINTQLATIPEVTCNIGELNQVFLNLIVNASHAIQESGQDAATGRITISTALQGDCVLVTVADNGCGIPQKNIEKIFDPFFTTKEVGKGTGQGLSITRSIVCERHGGRIDVQSEAAGGTQFTISLPIEGRAEGAVA